MPSVLQDWVQGISFKKQTVMIGAIRCPDVVHPLSLKRITVWIRNTVLRNADPLSGFMHGALSGELPLLETVDREFERLHLHTAHHIMLAMEVIGFEHPESEVRDNAWKFYSDCVRAQHLNPETRGQYESRYTDRTDRVEVGMS